MQLIRLLSKQERFKRLLERVIAAMTDDPQTWGFRVDPPNSGAIEDSVTYTAHDVDTRPDFVRRDDENWTSL